MENSYAMFQIKEVLSFSLFVVINKLIILIKQNMQLYK